MNRTINIALIGDHGGKLATHPLRFSDDASDDDVSARISAAIASLVLHTWAMSPGDTIKITEAD